MPADRTRPVVAAAGGVVWRPAGGGTGGRIETVVVHRPRYDEWALPKGKPDAGENAPTGGGGGGGGGAGAGPRPPPAREPPGGAPRGGHPAGRRGRQGAGACPGGRGEDTGRKRRGARRR